MTDNIGSESWLTGSARIYPQNEQGDNVVQYFLVKV
jgi:hypothetical protein